MQKVLKPVVLALIASVFIVDAHATPKSPSVIPTEVELAQTISEAHVWVNEVFSKPQIDSNQPTDANSPSRVAVPFSFVYGGVRSDKFLSGWNYSVKNESSGNRKKRVVCFEDPNSKLQVECEITSYDDTALVDWVCYLTNTGTKDTAIIENLMPLDSARIFDEVFADGKVMLRWSNGDKTYNDSFLYHDEQLKQGVARNFKGYSSMNSIRTEAAKEYCFPFFNVQVPGGGMIVAVGWTGKWKSEFMHNKDGNVTIRAGMQDTRFYLKPGERVRTPRVAMLRWSGSEMIFGHNQWRSAMLKHYVQWRDGKPAQPPIASCNVLAIYLQGNKSLNEQSELSFIDKLEPLGCEVYWMDAYWFTSPWHENIGSWCPRPEDFPRGLKPLAEAAHKKGLKFVLWFIPSVAYKNTLMAKEYPQCFYSGTTEGGLWKFEDPEARRVLVNWMSERKKEWDFDIWRDDGGNYMPGDGDPNRQGIAEMKYYEGMYNFWDGVLAAMPNLLIDNTNGGGNRIDIETNSRSFCQWRSDWNDIGEGLKGKVHWPYMALADQVMIAGLSLYIPFHSGPVWDMHPYSFRSAMSSGIMLYVNLQDPNFPNELAKQGVAELKELRPYFMGDIYPLLPLDVQQSSWYAYQLDRQDLKEGCAFFFRRPESNYLLCDISLYGIDPEAKYEVSITGETYKQGPWHRISGKKLRNLKVNIPEKPGSVLLRYKLVK